MAAKVELKISVNVGTGSVYNLGKIYDESVTVKVVVDASIAKDSSRFLKIPQDSPFGPLRGPCEKARAPGPPLFFVFYFFFLPVPF